MASFTGDINAKVKIIKFLAKECSDEIYTLLIKDKKTDFSVGKIVVGSFIIFRYK